MTATLAARRKAAEVAHRFTGWAVWVAAEGSPVATRSGNQRPPEPYDGNWAQTLIADDWDELETELAAQEKYDKERVSNYGTYALPYQRTTLVDHTRVYIADRIEPLVESADDGRRGGLADLVTTESPEVRLADMTLAPVTRAHLKRVLQEQRQRDLLASRGFAPLHRLLLTGPPGTGKSMTASAVATELSLPLVTIRLDALTSKYAGEIAVKLRVVYDAMTHPRSVYLFDGLDAIEARPQTWHEIGEALRILDMFLTFLDETQPRSLIVAVAEHPSLLDDALLRRFHAVIAYALPAPAQALALLRQRLAALNTSAVSWDELADHVKGLSQADLVRAAESAAKRAILHDEGSMSTAAMVRSLGELRRTHRVTGFGGRRSPA